MSNFTLAIALNMMQASTSTLGTWAAGKIASAACGAAWAAGCANVGGKFNAERRAAVRLGAFAVRLSSGFSLPVHARVQHQVQPDGLRAASSSRRLTSRWAASL